MNIKYIFDGMFYWTLQTSLYATVLIALVLLAQFVFRRKLPARWRYALGLLVLVRLALPFAPASPVSIFNLAHRSQPPARVVPVTNVIMPVPMPEVGTADLVLMPTEAGAGQGAVELVPLAPTPVRSGIKLLSILEALWLAGCCALLGVAARRYFGFKSASRGWGTVTEPRVLELLRECQAALGVRRTVRVLNAAGQDTPALFGHFRPMLLLPEEISRRLGDRELRHILLHELVHLKRGDVLVNWAMIALRAFHWFNPLVWLAFRRLRADQELACDAAVMHVLDAGERRDYGNTLIRMLEEFSAVRPCPGMVPLVPFFSRKQTIQRRITMIANFKPAGRVAAVASVALLVALGCLTFTCAAEKRSGMNGTDLVSNDPWGNPYIVAPDTQDARVVAQSVQWHPVDAATNSSKDELDSLKENIRSVQANIQEMRMRLRLDPNDAVAAPGVTDLIASLNATRAAAENESLKTEALLQELKKMNASKLRDTLPRITADPLLTGLSQDLLASETRLASIKMELGESHPDVKRVEAMRDQLTRQIQGQVEASLGAMQTRIDVARAQTDRVDELLAKAQEKSSKEAREYQLLSAELNRLEARRDALNAVQTQYQDVSSVIEGLRAQYDKASAQHVDSPYFEVLNRRLKELTAQKQFLEARFPELKKISSPDYQAGKGVNTTNVSFDQVLAQYKVTVDGLKTTTAQYERQRASYPAESPLLDAAKKRMNEFKTAKEQMEAMYPEVKTAESSAPGPIRISIGKDGLVHVDGGGTAVAFDRLTISLRDAAAKGRRVSMIIEADKDTKFDSLKEIMDAARSAGISDITLRNSSAK